VGTRAHISTSTGNRTLVVQPVGGLYTLFIYLFIHSFMRGLFNDAVNRSGYKKTSVASVR
jgi:hypothetical protein